MEFLDLVKIGSIVKVNVEASKDRLNSKTLEALKESPNCKVNDFRITDGKGIGVVLELSNGEKEWFFENEVDILDEEGKILKIKKKEESSILNFEFLNNLNYTQKDNPINLINPLNFFSWLLFSFKDVI